MKGLLFTSIAALLILPVAGPAGQARQAKPEASKTIDSLLAASWKEQGVEPAPIVDDETFARRLYLDAVGRIPTGAELRDFLADERPDRRHRLVDDLLDSEGYVNHMFHFWADILRIHDREGGGNSVVPGYIRHVRESLRDNEPYDEFVRELVSARGDALENGAIGYYYRDRGMPLDNMANTVRIFLGTRLECAQCHDHPFDKWTQMDFYHMAAYSYGVDTRNRREKDKFQMVQQAMNSDKSIDRDKKQDYRRALREIQRPYQNTPTVSYEAKKLPALPHDYQYDDAEPKAKITERVIFGADPEPASPDEKLDAYAEWMTSRDNPRFTKVIANRLWKKVMGLGLVEPVDEFVETTVPAQPELFAFLEEEMKRQDYDLKGFLAILFKTDVYQRASSAAEVASPKAYAFTGPLVRRMSAEQIWDSLVALINPRPETGDWSREQEEKLRTAGAALINEAIAMRSEEQLMEDVKAIAAAQKKMRDQLVSIQKQQQQARKKKDKEKADELGRKARDLRQSLAGTVFDRVYAPALKKAGAERVSLPAPEGGGTFQMKLEPDTLDDRGRVKREVIQELARRQEKALESEMDQLGMEEKNERRSYLGFRKNVSRNFLRAAHLASPAPDGHFLRRFGQSDRETIENAETSASVPQVLSLLNGNTFRTVTNPNSVFSRDVAAVDDPEKKIERIFLCLLSRAPTDEELKLLRPEIESRGDKFFEDLPYALLNTPEFFFIR